MTEEVKQKHPGGRPRKHTDDVKRLRLSVHVRGDEDERMLKVAAATEGKTLVDFVTEAAMMRARRVLGGEGNQAGDVIALVQIPSATPAQLAEADRRIEEAQRIGVYRWNAAAGDFEDTPLPFPVTAP